MKVKLALFFALALGWQGYAAKLTTHDYIDQYHKVAIKEMKEHGVPASITLAQGILESGSGNSYLATEANNHFGIKCHLDWDGKKVYHDDDEKGECFRKYKNAEESFHDHSLFLKNRSRYAFLFEESPTDYEAWAKGLKKAGYATNRKYDKLLIELIERYELHKYDLEGFDADHEEEDDKSLLATEQFQVSSNRVDYVIAKEGDSFELIAEATETRVEDLLRYNELSYDTSLEPGQIVYTQPKRRKAAREHEHYIVKEGDTMYGISQQFAIRLERLYKLNDMPVGQQPAAGTKLILR